MNIAYEDCLCVCVCVCACLSHTCRLSLTGDWLVQHIVTAVAAVWLRKRYANQLQRRI